MQQQDRFASAGLGEIMGPPSPSQMTPRNSKAVYIITAIEDLVCASKFASRRSSSSSGWCNLHASCPAKTHNLISRKTNSIVSDIEYTKLNMFAYCIHVHARLYSTQGTVHFSPVLVLPSWPSKHHQHHLMTNTLFLFIYFFFLFYFVENENDDGKKQQFIDSAITSRNPGDYIRIFASSSATCTVSPGGC